MTAPELTKEQEARRELPGGGKLYPVKHTVRIVVVHFTSDDQSLAAAEKELKRLPPPPLSSGTSLAAGALDATSAKPNSMFEALEPTDIVVVGQKPASVRTIDVSGNPVSGPADQPGTTRRLFAHNHHHKDTVLRLWTESDTVEYLCDEEFEIALVEQADPRISGAPEIPFNSGPLPYRSAQTPRATGGEPVWSWTSSVVPATANKQQYKLSFKIRRELIDPDVACGDPPPR